MPRWTADWVAPCKVVSKTHTAELLTALCSPNAQQTDCVLYQKENRLQECKHSTTMSCNMRRRKIGQVAPCTVVNKMHAAELLRTLYSHNVQQRDCVLCGRGG